MCGSKVFEVVLEMHFSILPEIVEGFHWLSRHFEDARKNLKVFGICLDIVWEHWRSVCKINIFKNI